MYVCTDVHMYVHDAYYLFIIHFSYELDLATFEQNNIKIGTIRSVRRRPVFVDDAELHKQLER